jgi:uncharacterized membrane protein YfcA
MPSLVPSLLAVASGGLVGFSLGLIGGGGSILAVPLLVYVVGVSNPHVAIGTSAAVVTASALVNLATYAQRGLVKWRCAGVFALFGIVGALVGSTAGKMIDGQQLLGLFALLMIAVASFMLKGREEAGDASVRLNRNNFPKLAAVSLMTGGLSGFFGIGGGFLIVPGLMLATGMPIAYAIGSSLVAIAAFGFATAGNYAIDGLVEWGLFGAFLLGGVLGAGVAMPVGKVIGHRGGLAVAFSLVLLSVAAYMLFRTAGGFLT